MSNKILSIDPTALSTVTGGTKHSGDPFLDDISKLASSIKDISAQTKGFSSTQMILLMGIALQRSQATNVVYVSGRRGRWW